MEKRLDILRTPEIKIKENCQTYLKVEDDNINKIIKKFISVLETNVSSDNLILLHNNISTLEVEMEDTLKKYISFILLDQATGIYDTINNIIYTIPPSNSGFLNMLLGSSKEEYKVILYHELFHMAATILGYYNGINFSGFSQRVKGEVGIGLALDDGYTERLLHRIFNISLKYIKYKYEFYITGTIERIVGTNEMTSEYLRADLYSLVNSLGRYSNINNIEDFIMNFDTLYQISYGEVDYINDRDIIAYHNSISNFILNITEAKLNEDLKSGLISMSTYDRRFTKCLTSLDRAFDSLGLVNKELIRRR